MNTERLERLLQAQLAIKAMRELRFPGPLPDPFPRFGALVVPNR